MKTAIVATIVTILATPAIADDFTGAYYSYQAGAYGQQSNPTAGDVLRSLNSDPNDAPADQPNDGPSPF